MTQQQFINDYTLKLLSDGQTHSIAEINTAISKSGLHLSKDSTLVRSVLSSMTKAGVITRVQRGIYSIIPESSKSKKHDALDSLDNYNILLPNSLKQNQLMVNILDNGHINLNGQLNKTIATRSVSIQFSPNYRKIKLVLNGPYPHIFTKAGSCKNMSICNELRKHRISLPARYIIYFNEPSQCYLGDLQIPN